VPSRKHFFSAGQFYHIYNRGNEGKPIFFERDNYLFFLKRMHDYSLKMQIDVVCYCLMPNHFHLLLKQAAEISIAVFMASLCTSYAKAINKRIDRAGHLFQQRYQEKIIDKNEYLLYLFRYIHLNPVVAGLAKRPEDWEFSSYRDFIDLRSGRLPKREYIFNEFIDVGQYREFMQMEDVEKKIKGYVFD